MKIISLQFGNKHLERVWKCYEKGESVSPFVYYDYIKYIRRHTAFFSPKYRIVILCVADEKDEILMIAPLKKEIFGGKYKMLGDLQGCGATGFIFKPSMSESDRELCLDLLFDRIGKRAAIRRVKENDVICSYLHGKKLVKSLSKVECVAVSLPENYDEYISSLSSSVRQNIRTAYNRLKRDGKSLELKIYRGGQIPEDVRKEVMKVYIGRLFSKYKKKSGLLLWYYLLKYNYIKHDTKSLFELSNAFHSILYIDGKIAAFANGLQDFQGNQIVVPRLAIDINCKFYSPGYLLLCETVKYLIENTNVRCYDLSRGTEKYKFDLGGKSYWTHSFRLGYGGG